MKVLVTGGAGFIGTNFVKGWFPRRRPQIIVIDAMTYASNAERVDGVEYVKGDILDIQLVRKLMKGVVAVVHFAAETHVDRSIAAPDAFIETNIRGTHTLLEAVRQESKAIRFLHVSTDEVYGSLGEFDAPFTEASPYAPNSPYAASKAASDHLVRAYHKTYGLPTIITHCSNNYGPWQHREKFIPNAITSVLEGKPITLYGNGLNIRDWIHVDDHCSALRYILFDGEPGEVYNIGAGQEKTNLAIAATIAGKLGGNIKFIEDRAGHDFRYAIDATKVRALGWKPKETFESGLEKTIAFYKESK